MMYRAMTSTKRQSLCYSCAQPHMFSAGAEFADCKSQRRATVALISSSARQQTSHTTALSLVLSKAYYESDGVAVIR